MELSKKLQASGWHFTEEGLKTLSTAVGEDPDPSKIINVALNTDLREIGGGALPSKRDDGSGTLSGRIVLQVQRVRNIAAPKSNEESKAAPRLLQLELSDGQTSLQALELEPVPALSLNVPPGTKIHFHAEKLQLLQGYLLLRPNELKILGGRVDAMYEKWDFARTMLKYARSGRPLSGTSAPPPWVTFGKNIDANTDRNFKSLVPAEKDKPSKENDEFNNMRSEAIAVASKAGVKKVFGGGGQNIVDHNMKKILEKGYSKEEAKAALQMTHNNLERALFNLKRRKDAVDGSSEPHIRGGRGERNGREGKRGLKDEVESAKPAANATLFDFLTTKLRTDTPLADIAGDIIKPASSVEKPIVKQYDTDSKPSAVHQSESKSHSFAERTRFENNISSSFAANRGSHAGRFQRGGTRSRAGRDERPPRSSGSSYIERGSATSGAVTAGGGASAGSAGGAGGAVSATGGSGGTGAGATTATNVRKHDTNSRASDHSKTHAHRNGHDNPASSKGTSESKPENSAKDLAAGNSRRGSERQTNRNGNTRPENGTGAAGSNPNNRRRQQGNGSSVANTAVPLAKPSNAVNSNTDEFNNRLNKVVTETANLKIGSSKREHRRGGRNSGGQPTRQPSEAQAQAQVATAQVQKPVEKSTPAPRPNKAQQENVRRQSNVNCTQLPNGYTYDPSKIMGFQTKEANEFAMSLLKSQGLSIAAPGQTQTAPTPVQPTGKETNILSTAPAQKTNSVVPPNPQPAAATTSPKGFATNSCDAWLWKSGDLCMAKYWDDGRYYEAEITAVSENTCVVLFLGYGNYEEVLKSDILPITDSQNRPFNNMSHSQHAHSRHRNDRQVVQQQVYVPPHKREY